LRAFHALLNVQHTATNCNTLQHSAVCIHKHLFNPPQTCKICTHDTHCNTCNALQQIATPCNALQCVYTCTFSNPHELSRFVYICDSSFSTGTTGGGPPPPASAGASVVERCCSA